MKSRCPYIAVEINNWLSRQATWKGGGWKARQGADDKMGPWVVSLAQGSSPEMLVMCSLPPPSWQHVSGEKGEEPEVEPKDFSKEKQKGRVRSSH